MSIRPRRTTLGLVLLPLLAACPAERDSVEATRMDTTSDSWEDGLSAQQMENRARALSPEEAAAQGLAVDTSIHLELPQEQDTVLLPRSNEPTPAPVDPVASDTLRPPAP